MQPLHRAVLPRVLLALLAAMVLLPASPVGGVLPTARAAAPAAAAATGPWFHLLPDVTASWTLRADPHDPLRYTLAPDKQPAAGQPKRILILFAVKSPLFDAMLSALCSTFLADGVPVVFTLMFFKGSDALGRADLRLAVAQHMDLIFSAGSATTAFMHDNFSHGSIPVVTIMSKDPVLLNQIPGYSVGSGTDIAYTSVNVPVDLQITYLRQLKPHLKNIAILSSDDDVSARTTQVKPIQQAAPNLGARALDVAVTDEQHARAQLSVSVPQAIAWMRRTDPSLQNSVFWMTASTAVIDQFSTVDRLSEHVPVVSVYPELVRAGEDSATLSIGVSFSTASRLAAHYGVLILRGQAGPGSLPVGTVSPPDIAINFLKAHECGLQIPFQFFESATYVYDEQGRLVRRAGVPVKAG